MNQSRYIILDISLLFFMGLLTLFGAYFVLRNEAWYEGHPTGGERRERGPYSIYWWTYLALAGLSFGAVGLVIILTVGASTLK
jgi:dolichyl-phosphate-mannose--protein O-mannosyl transferase